MISGQACRANALRGFVVLGAAMLSCERTTNHLADSPGVEDGSAQAKQMCIESEDAAEGRKLSEAILSNNLARVKELIEAGIDVNTRFEGWTALMVANSPEVVRYLLARGAVVEARSRDGRGAHYEDITPLIHISGGRCAECVELLIDAGADVNARARDGTTALIAAASIGEARSVELLVDHGARLDEQDLDGWTALMGAASWSRVTIVKMLLERKAAVDLVDSKGETALMKVADSCGPLYGDVAVRVLVAGGADRWLRNKQGKTALQIAMRTDRQIKVDCTAVIEELIGL